MPFLNKSGALNLEKIPIKRKSGKKYWENFRLIYFL